MTGRPTYTEALLELGAKIDALADCVGRQEEILIAINQINGHVRIHGEAIATHQQWLESHEGVHMIQDRNFRALSSRVWTLSGGSGLLAIVATVLQFLRL